MGTVRKGSVDTLLVVDVQVGVMANAWNARPVVTHIARAVQRARAAGTRVIWVQHESDELQPDSPAWQWVPELVPADGEQRVRKRYASSFEATDLDALLAEAGTTHLVLAGAQSNWCIRATAYAALERGYDLTLLSDAHTTEHLDLGHGARVDASAIVADLNAAMTWLRYPGRRNAAIPAEAVEFGAAALLPIVAVQETHAASYRACLDAVAREQRYLAQIEALPLERIEAFVRASVANDAVQFFALDGEQVVGWADIFPSWAHAVSHCGTLGMGVLASHRGQGLGRRLLQACIDKAWAKGITRIELEVRSDNVAAIGLYEAMGFAHEAVKRNALRFGGRYFDALQMSLLRD